VFVRALLYGAVGSFILVCDEDAFFGGVAFGFERKRVGIFDDEQIIRGGERERVHVFQEDFSALIGQDFKDGAMGEGRFGAWCPFHNRAAG
jgi:hypothetical protein